MARVFITGSSDGLGLMAARLVLEQGHDVVLHARNDNRANEVRSKLPGADAVAIGDLSTITQTKSVAEQLNR
jgi:NAD(P)-dependent dehydrogenase (short-subunit alcohol dehydrogenase family)